VWCLTLSHSLLLFFSNARDVAAILHSDDILQSFVLGCEEVKNPRVVQISVGSLHHLITNNALPQVRSRPSLSSPSLSPTLSPSTSGTLVYPGLGSQALMRGRLGGLVASCRARSNRFWTL
jgi:hypothetical protein